MPWRLNRCNENCWSTCFRQIAEEKLIRYNLLVIKNMKHSISNTLGNNNNGTRRLSNLQIDLSVFNTNRSFNIYNHYDKTFMTIMKCKLFCLYPILEQTKLRRHWFCEKIASWRMISPSSPIVCKNIIITATECSSAAKLTRSSFRWARSRNSYRQKSNLHWQLR